MWWHFSWCRRIFSNRYQVNTSPHIQCGLRFLKGINEREALIWKAGATPWMFHPGLKCVFKSGLVLAGSGVLLVLESAYHTKIVKKNNFSSNKKDLQPSFQGVSRLICNDVYVCANCSGHRVVILTLPQKSCSNNFLNQGSKEKVVCHYLGD